jgi:hypothetical protein
MNFSLFIVMDENLPNHSIYDGSHSRLGHVGHHFGQQVSNKEFRDTWTGSLGHLESVKQFIQRTFARATVATTELL